MERAWEPDSLGSSTAPFLWPYPWLLPSKSQTPGLPSRDNHNPYIVAYKGLNQLMPVKFSAGAFVGSTQHVVIGCHSPKEHSVSGLSSLSTELKDESALNFFLYRPVAKVRQLLGLLKLQFRLE